jgi:hypothetical protein
MEFIQIGTPILQQQIILPGSKTNLPPETSTTEMTRSSHPMVHVWIFAILVMLLLIPPSRVLHLSNALHVPNAFENLIYVHRFSNDNHASLEYFPNHFFTKDLDTRKVLQEGQCKDGLYPIPISWRQVFGTFKPMLR